MLLCTCNSICSESTNKRVYDFFSQDIGQVLYHTFFFQVFVYFKKSEVVLNAYQCYNFEE